MYKKKFHVIIFLILIVVLCFSISACSKPAGEGGINNNNIGKDSTIVDDLSSYIETNNELVNNLLTQNGYTDCTLKVVDVMNYSCLDSYVDKLFDYTDETLTETDRGTVEEKNRYMKKNIKNVFEKNGIRSLVIDTGDSLILEYGVVGTPANYFESFCEYVCATQNPYYKDNYAAEMNFVKEKYKNKVLNYKDYILLAEDSNIFDSFQSIFVLLDAIEKRGDFEYVKGSNMLVNYLGNDAKVVLPENVTRVLTGAFANKQFIDEIVINKNMPIIDKNAFDHIFDLKVSINTDEDIYLTEELQRMLIESNSEFISYNSRLLYYEVDKNYSLPSHYNSNNSVYENHEYVKVSPKAILNECLKDKGYENANISFANKHNRYYFDKYIEKYAKDNNYTDEQITNINNLYDILFKDYCMCVMVVVQDGEAVDIIENLCTFYIDTQKNLPLNIKQVAYAFDVSFVNPDIDINSKDFQTVYSNNINNILRVSYGDIPIIYVYDGDKENLLKLSEFMCCNQYEDNARTLTIYDELYNSTYGLININSSFINDEFKSDYNISYYFDGAFKNAQNLKRINISNVEKAYFGHNLFNGNNDVLIVVTKALEDINFEFSNDWYVNGDKSVGIMYGVNLNSGEFNIPKFDIYNKNGPMNIQFDKKYYDLAQANRGKAENKISELNINCHIDINAVNHPDNTLNQLPNWPFVNIYDNNSFNNIKQYYNYFKCKIYDLTYISFTDMGKDFNIINSNTDTNNLIRLIFELGYNEDNYDVWYQNMINNKRLIIESDYIIINNSYNNSTKTQNYLSIRDVLFEII